MVAFGIGDSVLDLYCIELHLISFVEFVMNAYAGSLKFNYYMFCDKRHMSLFAFYFPGLALVCINADFCDSGVIFSVFRDLHDLNFFAPIQTQLFGLCTVFALEKTRKRHVSLVTGLLVKLIGMIRIRRPGKTHSRR